MTQAADLSALSQAFTAAALGFRNRFINGDMRIWQRGNSVAVPVNNPIYAAVDRWYGYTAGSAATMIAGWQTPSGRLAMRLTASAAGNTGMAMGQRIEQGQCWDLANQLVTVTAWVASEGNANPTFTCSAFVWTNADNPGGGGAWAGGTVDVLAQTGGWYYIRARIQLPANAYNGFSVEFGFPAVANGKSNAMGDVQIERGYINTPFEQRPIGLEQMLCQRYYETGNVEFRMSAGASTDFPFGNSQWTSLYVRYSAAKRVTPSLVGQIGSTASSLSGIWVQFNNTQGNVNLGPTLDGPNGFTLGMGGTVNSGWAHNTPNFYVYATAAWQASAELQ